MCILRESSEAVNKPKRREEAIVVREQRLRVDSTAILNGELLEQSQTSRR
jgi:hypothetical protein